MIKKYLPAMLSILFYGAAILAINLLAVFIYGVFLGILNNEDIFQAVFYFTTLANALFLEGGIILTVGAFLEFFIRSASPSVGRSMMRPYKLLSRQAAAKIPDKDAVNEEYSGGWMLIFTGTMIVIISAMFAIISLK
jgi:hypothetical protein